ncbi:MAG TPA: hypothetical protein VHV83_00670 [Armatimonadota bacterium]|nr:hypothetical protein [Armatimonadota bacterium]
MQNHRFLCRCIDRLSFSGSLILIALIVIMVACPSSAQMVTGSKMIGYAETLGVVPDQRAYPYSAQLTQSSIPGNVLWPGDKATFTFQLVNNNAQPVVAQGKVDVIEYGTKGRPGDVWTPIMFKIADVGSIPINVNMPAKGFVNITVSPDIPAKFGAYALVADLGPLGRQFITTCVRTFPSSTKRIQYPSFCLDIMPVDVSRRLGVQAVRYGIDYFPTTAKDFDKRMASLDKQLKELQDNNVAVLLMIGAGSASQPLGQPRPHLTDDGVMMQTKSDMAWLPENDDDFQKWVTIIASKYGWPKGPVNAFSLWNEPWEGISISGWGADMLRYRDMFTRMALAVEQARKDARVDVLTGGCDSSSNTYDKLFADGTDTFLKWLDFCSIHYQGLQSPCLDPAWVNRKSPRGRVRIWDTESWIANCDDRVAAVVASNRAAGYDRAMGIYGGNIYSEQKAQIFTPDGKKQPISVVHAWSVAAAVGASQHFIGERKFKELLFKNGLPWVMVFNGLANTEDGTVVVVGDLGDEYNANDLPFRTARGLKELADKEEIRARLAALPADAPAKDRATLEAELNKSSVLSGATMTIANPSGAFSLYDFYGNQVPTITGKITIPLDGRGFFLRANGKRGSFKKLLAAVNGSQIDGFEPIATQAHDLTASIAQKPALRLTLTNILNRPVTGTLTVTLGNLKLDSPKIVSFKANETKDVLVNVLGGEAVPSNKYSLKLIFDAGKNGKAIHYEDLHVNVIAKRAITVDGKLDDWKGVLPQTVSSSNNGGPTLTEAAWFPFVKYDDSVKKGFANGYLAYDSNYFYFAAKIADDTPEAGMIRYETRNDDEYFYPQKSYVVDPEKTLEKRDVIWADSSKDIRALQKPGDTQDRVAAVWEATSKSFAIDVKMANGEAHQLALYFLDWDDLSRRTVKVEISDLASGKILDRRDVNTFRYGKYAIYNIAGNVRIKISTNSWISGTLSGLFFDPVKTAIKPNGTMASFVKIDEETQGNWKGLYGNDGYNIISQQEKYPQYATISLPTEVNKQELTWPDGVRRYSYRKRPDLPAGNAPNHDNVQIAFNVMPVGKDGMLANPPGVMPGFTGYKDTDYEYALNPVAPQYGGGTEIWRLNVPGMPRKQFYPRQPASPFDGPVKNGKLVTLRDGNTRIVEAALPWSEIPDVKKALDAGKTIKFSFRVNDNGAGGYELSTGRSVAKRNSLTFHADWVEHWANEIEFAFEK